MRTCHLHDFHSKDRVVPLEIPPLSDIATGFVFVGALFLLRFVLAIRRLKMEVAETGSWQRSDFARVRRAGGYGEELEPERRHAARQFVIGALCLCVGLVLFVWLLIGILITRLDLVTPG